MRKLALPFLLLLTACPNYPPGAYTNSGDPEQQLVTTNEAVSIELNTSESVDQLKETLRSDPPVRAELSCPATSLLCKKAKTALLTARIPLEISGKTDQNAATLIYQRTTARACEHSYIDNSQNSGNLNYSSLGCSLRSNMLQMVTDKQQFVNPALLDYSDGEKAAQNYQTYVAPTAATPGGTAATTSLIGATGTGQ